MKLVGAIVGLLIMPLGSGEAVAAPQLEYFVVGPSEETAGMPGGKKAWELRDSLSRTFNYRVSGHNQSSFMYRDEEWFVHNLTTNASGVSLLLDWHPMAGRLRFSGGLFSYKQFLDYAAAPTIDEVFEYKLRFDPQEIVDDVLHKLQERGVSVDKKDVEPYLPEDMSPQVITITKHIEFDAEDLSAHAQVKYKSVAPYFGLGWSNRFFSFSRLHYSFDLGFLYQADPDINVTLQGDVMDNIKPAVRTWVDRWTFEQEQKLGKKLEQHTWSPRLGFGLSYRLN